MSRISDRHLRNVTLRPRLDESTIQPARPKVLVVKGDGMTGPRTQLPAEPAPEPAVMVDPTLVDQVKRGRCGNGNGSGSAFGGSGWEGERPRGHHHHPHHGMPMPVPIGVPQPQPLPLQPGDPMVPAQPGGPIAMPVPLQPGEPIAVPGPADPSAPIGIAVPYEPREPVSPRWPRLPPEFFGPITIDPVRPYNPTLPFIDVIGPVNKTLLPVPPTAVEPETTDLTPEPGVDGPGEG